MALRDQQNAREARAFYQEAQRIYKLEPEPPCITVGLHFCARKGEQMSLTCRDRDGNEYTADALPAEQARTRATTREEIESGLRKTGGTVFAPAEIAIELDDGLRVPMSAVNALRRRCLEGLEAVRHKAPARRQGVWEPGLRRDGHQGQPGFIFSFLRFEQVTPKLLDLKPDFVYLPLAEVHRHRDLCEAITAKGQKIAAVLDRITFDSQWPGQIEMLRDMRRCGVGHLVCGNLSHPALLAGLDMELRGDFGLNVMNSQTLKELKALGPSTASRIL